MKPIKRAQDQRTVEEVEALAERKAEFFLIASHQLKTPVSIIQWCLQSVIEAGRVQSKDEELVRKALVQAGAISLLIADMMHVFKLQDRKKHGNSLELVSLNQVIDEVVTQYELVAHKRDIHLQKGPIESAILVMAEPIFLKQAIINLVDNAIKYTPAGGMVKVMLHTAHEKAFVTVEDEGIGISEAEQHRLFSEFFRGEEAQAMTKEGTGLGLVLVKKIIEEFGGVVTVESALGKGSKFTLSLPISSNISK